MPSAARFLLWPGLPAAAAAAALLAIGAVHSLIKATAPDVPAAAAPPPAAAPLPFLQQWCYECHGGGAAKGGLAMDAPGTLTGPAWEKIRRQVVLRTMPPPDQPAPSPGERGAFEDSLLTWQALQPAAAAPPAFRRLTRREFAGSLQDLLGHSPDISSLPDEEPAHGFDNNAGLQPLPPAALERYAAVTRDAVGAALLPPPVPAAVRRYMPQEFTGSGGPSLDNPACHGTETAEPVRLPVTLATAGRYRFSLKAYAHQAGDEPVRAGLLQAPPQSVRSVQRTAPEVVSILADLPAGPSLLTFHLANPLRDPRHPDPHHRVRRLLVQEVSLEGPLDGDATPTASFLHRFGPLPEQGGGYSPSLRAAGTVLTAFARRAWRRPLAAEESSRLTALAGQAMAHGLRYDQSLAVAVQAILTSPHFLFLTDPAAAGPASRPYATAARLSSLLWSTLPDEALLRDSQQSWTPVRLRTAATRLLDDPRAAALARDFAGQWLQLRNTTLARPDAGLFPQVTPQLLVSMQESAGRFFLHLVRENQPVLHLLDASYAFADAPMAAFLGLPGVPGAGGFRKVELPDPDHYGLLGQPAVLLLTSYPNRTSPVLRGKYVLETLLGLEPPPPPPNIPTLPSAAGPGPGPHSVRTTLETHRSDPSCAACHRAIDPLGFPLEGFDAIGRPLHDPTGDLSSRTFTGQALHGPASLRAWLTGEQGPRIVHHAAERLLTYALGRGLSAAEKQSAHRLADQCGGRDARFRDLLMAIITSPAFRGEAWPSSPAAGPP